MLPSPCMVSLSLVSAKTLMPLYGTVSGSITAAGSSPLIWTFPLFGSSFLLTPIPGRACPLSPAFVSLPFCQVSGTAGFWPEGFPGDAQSRRPHDSLFPCGHTLEWSVSNQSNDALLHGNSGSAGLEVLLDGLWYGVPWKTDLNYGVTAESYTLEPGGRTSISQLPQHYGDGFPDGRYRIVLHYHIYDRKTDTYQDAGFSAAEFQIQDSLFFCPDIS